MQRRLNYLSVNKIFSEADTKKCPTFHKGLRLTLKDQKAYDITKNVTGTDNSTKNSCCYCGLSQKLKKELFYRPSNNQKVGCLATGNPKGYQIF